MSEYKILSPEIASAVLKREEGKRKVECIRRDMSHDKENVLRPAFVRDVEKILNSPYYNRYSDKTQVLSLHRNDDISRRSYHVQLVSRIARNIGRMLGLDLDLIEAIALGHDIGHTPFGHAGEDFLNECYNEATGRYFNHNVHSVRVLDGIFNHNISLAVLDGILCHNGEFELKEYVPSRLSTFEEFDQKIEKCYTDKGEIKRLISNTLEGCVVRISDMIAYIGKDRQDAIRSGIISNDEMFETGNLGRHNSAIINNLIVSIVHNSFKKDFIMLDDESYLALKNAKKQNNEFIYRSVQVRGIYDTVHLMFERMYKKLYDELSSGDKNSVIFRHHIDFVKDRGKYYLKNNYEDTEKNQIVVDYIASMTDDYFVDLYNYLFPKDTLKLKYVGYFD